MARRFIAVRHSPSSVESVRKVQNVAHYLSRICEWGSELAQMSLQRVDCFFEKLRIPDEDRVRIEELAQVYSAKSRGMMHLEDLKAIGAALLSCQPKLLFEIGTFRGNTSDYCLSLLPQLQVVSIAYVAPKLKLFGKSYNNAHDARDEIGCDLQEAHRSRFKQLYGDSHKLSATELVEEYGHFDFVIVDGDHTAEGVMQDTLLASELLQPNKGAVCWHDANPKEKYMGVRDFLEEQLDVEAIATSANYIGGIAFWEGAPSALRATVG